MQKQIMEEMSIFRAVLPFGRGVKVSCFEFAQIIGISLLTW